MPTGNGQPRTYDTSNAGDWTPGNSLYSPALLQELRDDPALAANQVDRVDTNGSTLEVDKNILLWFPSVLTGPQEAAADAVVLAHNSTQPPVVDPEPDIMSQGVNQVAHGFVVGDCLRLDAGVYVKAQADTAGNSEAQGIVSAVADVDNFTITLGGRISTLSGLTADQVYYLSDVTPGLLQIAEPTISKPMLYALSATEGVVYHIRALDTTPANTALIRIGHTYAIVGEILLPSGDDNFVIPFNVSLAAGQTAAVVSCRYSINSGTSVTCKLQKNGVDLTGFTGITVTTTPTSTDPADQAVADNDELALVVTAVAGTPKNLSFTIFIENTLTVS